MNPMQVLRRKCCRYLPVILSLTTDVRDIQAAQHGDADSGQIEPIQNANIQITSGKLT